MSVKRFVPSLSTAVVAGLVARIARPRTRLQRFLALLLVLNWRSLPFVWHVQLWGLVPRLHARIHYYGLEKTLSIAKNPFDTKIVTKGSVTIDAADWNGHLSNTSYGKALDIARFAWLLDVVGPSMGPEGIMSFLGGTSYYFYKEIPMFAKYEMEVHVVSWDDKWMYYVCKFTTAPKKGSKERVLNCVALSRSCFKLRDSRLSIPPSRVLSVSGLGPDHTNWDRTMKLRKEKKAKKWLKFGGALIAKKNGSTFVKAEDLKGEEGWEEDGMGMYEERRIKQMEIVSRFANVDGWLEL